MRERFCGAAAVIALTALTASSHAGLIVDFNRDAGGENTNPLNGLSARATFDIDGLAMTILLENTSTGAPDGFDVSDSLLVSIGFDLGDVRIVSSESAVIGVGSFGLGAWSARGEGDAVNEEWAWTNDGGGDRLESFAQVISTSNGFGSGIHTRFDGVENGNVGGPFGGIAPTPLLFDVPDAQHAVSNAILFSLTLSDTLSQLELERVANRAIVEFGSDTRYLGAPGPSAVALLLLAGLARRRRRRTLCELAGGEQARHSDEDRRG